jgi:glycosyltransferase involved in cell wall biosynthesis
VWSRKEQAMALAEKIRLQTEALGKVGEVEHLVLFDNKVRPVGGKRQSLVDTALGKYFAFVDDDDDIADNYVGVLLGAARNDADVIAFRQRVIYNGQEGEVDFSAFHQDEQFRPGVVTKRNLWHVCAWRREAVEGCQFGWSNYGEDLAWCIQARKRVKSQTKLDIVLHTYRHDALTTEAPPP